MSRFYFWLAQTPVGGFHEWGPLSISIHDRGFGMAWNRVRFWDVRQ